MMTVPPNPIPSPELSRYATAADHQLAQIDVLREQMREQFHTYQEIQQLTAADRDALFQILFDAQRGDPTSLHAIRELVYDELPVDMEEFILGPRYLALDGLINAEKLEILALADQPHRREVHIAAGSGGGKSFLVSIAMAREVYKLLCLKKPDMYYMLGPGSKFAVINLSVSKDQARDIIFAEFVARIANSPWFSRFQTQKLSSRARFPKRVYVFSGGSSATSYYGYHTKFGSLDEASFLMDRDGGKSVAADLVEALSKSLNTRFPLDWKLWVISTLRSADDYLYQQIEDVKETGVRLR